ncbi:hypothetical protein MBANPS3_010928 [Mucor bainieri]
MLTRGLAACIILDLVPTPENRILAKRSMDNSCFEVVHTADKQLDPFPIGKSFVEKNPHKYKTFPDTPPPSPQLAPTPSPSQSPPLVSDFRQQQRKSKTGCGPSSSNSSSSINLKANKRSTGTATAIRERDMAKDNQTASNNKPPSRESNPKQTTSNSKPRNIITALIENQSVIMKITKALFVRTHPYHDKKHRLVYATDQHMYNTLMEHIPISRIWTIDEFVEALKDNKDHFQDYDEVNGKRDKRILYMVKEEQQSHIVKKILFDSIPNLCTYF